MAKLLRHVESSETWAEVNKKLAVLLRCQDQAQRWANSRLKADVETVALGLLHSPRICRKVLGVVCREV